LFAETVERYTKQIRCGEKYLDILVEERNWKKSYSRCVVMLRVK